MVIKRIIKALFLCSVSLQCALKVERTFLDGVDSTQAAAVIQGNPVLNQPDALVLLLDAGVTSALAQQVEGEDVISPFVRSLNGMTCDKIVVDRPRSVIDWLTFPEPDLQKHWKNLLFGRYDHFDPSTLNRLSPSFSKSLSYIETMSDYLAKEANLVEKRDQLNLMKENLEADKEGWSSLNEEIQRKKKAYAHKVLELQQIGISTRPDKTELYARTHEGADEKAFLVEAIKQLKVKKDRLNSRETELERVTFDLGKECQELKENFKFLHRELHTYFKKGFVVFPHCGVLLTQRERSFASLVYAALELVAHSEIGPEEKKPSNLVLIGDSDLVKSAGAAFQEILELSGNSSIKALHLIGFALPPSDPVFVQDRTEAVRSYGDGSSRVRTPLPFYPATPATPPSPEAPKNSPHSCGGRDDINSKRRASAASLGSSPSGRGFVVLPKKRLNFENSRQMTGLESSSGLQARLHGELKEQSEPFSMRSFEQAIKDPRSVASEPKDSSQSAPLSLYSSFQDQE